TSAGYSSPCLCTLSLHDALPIYRLGSVGRDIGPELSGAGARYSPRDLLESLIDPSKVISDQYRNIRVFLTDGEEVSGRLVREDRSEEHTSELQSRENLVCRLLLE